MQATVANADGLDMVFTITKDEGTRLTGRDILTQKTMLCEATGFKIDEYPRVPEEDLDRVTFTPNYPIDCLRYYSMTLHRLWIDGFAYQMKNTYFLPQGTREITALMEISEKYVLINGPLFNYMTTGKFRSIELVFSYVPAEEDEPVIQEKLYLHLYLKFKSEPRVLLYSFETTLEDMIAERWTIDYEPPLDYDNSFQVFYEIWVEDHADNVDVDGVSEDAVYNTISTFTCFVRALGTDIIEEGDTY